MTPTIPGLLEPVGAGRTRFIEVRVKTWPFECDVGPVQ